MLNAITVARYVVNYSNEKGYGISNLKLQKILYFIQAQYLAFTKEQKPCFPDRIEAWDFGPVVPVVYHEFKQYGNNSIPSVEYYLEVNKENFWASSMEPFSNDEVPNCDKKIINEVVDAFSDFSASNLVELTHQQAPWKKAYVRGANNEITQESIREYFQTA